MTFFFGGGGGLSKQWKDLFLVGFFGEREREYFIINQTNNIFMKKLDIYKMYFL